MDIIGRTGDQVNSIRDRTNVLRQEKDALFKQAYDSQNGAQRDALFIQANKKKVEFEQAEIRVGDEIFAMKNKGYGDDQMDLHGLTVKESERVVELRLTKVHSKIASGGFELTIITGAGHHSENNVAKIKPAIIDLLRSKGYRFHEDDTGGMIMVSATGQPTSSIPGGGSKPAQKPADDFEAFIESVFAFFSCFGGGRGGKRSC